MTLAGLRIVLVGPLPPPAGGMANQTRQLAELLAGEGAVVDVVQVNAPYRPTWVGSLQGVRAVFRLVPYIARLIRSVRRADMVHVMANSGWSWHLFAAPAVWIAAALGVPVVVNYRGGEAEPFLARSARWVRPTLRRASALAVPSAFLKDVFGRHDIAAAILPNIIDLERFRPSDVDGAVAHLVVARNLEPIYDVATAIRAFRIVRQSHPEAKLSVAGSGPERGALESLARELGVGDSVVFTGRLDRDQMATLYRAATLVLNPTTVDNMPNSLLEAMASGVPIVSTDVGGVPFMVSPERTALLVPRGDSAAMAVAVTRLLDDAGLRTSLRANGLVDVQRYSWSSVRKELVALYARCLQRRSKHLTAT